MGSIQGLLDRLGAESWCPAELQRFLPAGGVVAEGTVGNGGGSAASNDASEEDAKLFLGRSGVLEPPPEETPLVCAELSFSF